MLQPQDMQGSSKGWRQVLTVRAIGRRRQWCFLAGFAAQAVAPALCSGFLDLPTCAAAAPQIRLARAWPMGQAHSSAPPGRSMCNLSFMVNWCLCILSSAGFVASMPMLNKET